MKPFYRVLTYLVMVVQSVIILCLLAEKKQPAGIYAARNTPHPVAKVAPREAKQTCWIALSADLLYFRSTRCSR